MSTKPPVSLRGARERNSEGRSAPSLALLAAVTALAFCALHMVVPALPLLVTVFGDSTAHVQLVLSLYLAGIAAGQLIYGPLSDRFGRRPVLIAGLAMFLIGTLLCGIAWSLPVLIFGRVLQALGACAGIVLSRAIIRDVYDREMAARGLALVMMAMTLAPAISPALGAYLTEWFGWRAIFALLGVLGAVVFVVTVVRLAETNLDRMHINIAGMMRSYATLLRSRAFAGFALCSACTSASWFTFIASAPYLVSEVLHQPPSTYGLMILFPMTTYMLGNAAAARFALRIGSLRLLLAGRAIALGGATVVTLWYLSGGFSVWALFLPIAFAEIGDGLSQPSVVAAGLSIHPRMAGTASGLMGFLQMTMAAIASFVVAVLPHDSPLGMILVFSAFVVLALGSGIFAVRQTRRADRMVLPAVATAGDGK